MKDLEDKHRKDLQRQIQATLPHLMKLRQQCITSRDSQAQISVERFTRFLRNLQDELDLPPVVTDEALTIQQKILESSSLPELCRFCYASGTHSKDCPQVLQP